jgi:hypothetical protein
MNHRQKGAFWEAFFPTEMPERETQTVSMRLVRKGGHPWLLVPAAGRLAAKVLELYPAQSLKARLARTGLRLILRAGLPLGTEAISMKVTPGTGFTRFLAGLADNRTSTTNHFPVFGILAGNPATPGQRFIVLVFNASGKPAAVVKAGLSERARELIAKEETFLAEVPPNTPGVPSPRARFETAGLRALALDFFAGVSPDVRDDGRLSGLLSSWVNVERQILVSQTRVWQELKAACGQNPLFAKLMGRLETRPIRPTIAHGDLAPWNVKVQSGGQWMVLDWERGEREGIPTWDWFHYVLQPAILVGHKPAGMLSGALDELLLSPSFEAYAKLTQTSGLERALCLAYLLYNTEVTKPSEGLAEARELLLSLGQRWQNPGAGT